VLAAAIAQLSAGVHCIQESHEMKFILEPIARFFRSLVSRVGIASSLLRFIWSRKVWWMTPLVLMILIVGILVIFGQSGAISAFIYTLF
jgi:hypothetical protein